jgi:hypothetical protein
VGDAEFLLGIQYGLVVSDVLGWQVIRPQAGVINDGTDQIYVVFGHNAVPRSELPIFLMRIVVLVAIRADNLGMASFNAGTEPVTSSV